MLDSLLESPNLKSPDFYAENMQFVSGGKLGVSSAYRSRDGSTTVSSRYRKVRLAGIVTSDANSERLLVQDGDVDTECCSG